MVAKAWSDPVLPPGAARGCEQGGCDVCATGGNVGEHLVAVENTPQTHNMIVCTLCSCYPWDVLGLPPVWYKSFAYRSRAVKEPRAVLAISA